MDCFARACENCEPGPRDCFFGEERGARLLLLLGGVFWLSGREQDLPLFYPQSFDIQTEVHLNDSMYKDDFGDTWPVKPQAKTVAKHVFFSTFLEGLLT